MNVLLHRATADARDALGGSADTVADVDDLTALRSHLAVPGVHTVVLGPSVPLEDAVRLADENRVARPDVGVVLQRDAVEASAPEVLATALRSGVREVVRTDDPAALRDAVRRSDELGAAIADRTPPSAAAPAQGKVVTVFSAKGGCGKTTVSTNVGALLAAGGRRRVVVVDLDLAFGDVAIALQLFPSRTIADAVPLARDLDFPALEGLLTPHSTGLTTLVAPTDPATGDSIPAALVTRVLELLREHFDYVVVDTPPAFDDQVLAAFDMSDVVVLLATLDIPALKNLKLTLETLEILNYPQERWKVVINRSDSKVGLSMVEVEKTLQTRISAQVPSSRDVPASVNRGVPIVLDDPRHPVSAALREFVERELVTRPPAASQVPGGLRRDRRGLLRRRDRR